MSGDNQYVVFYLDDNIFAIPLSNVERIVRAVEVTCLPDAPEVLLGVFNMRGRIIPVIDMRNRFRIKKKDLEPWHQFIIVSNSRRTVALWVDGVSGVIERTAEEIVAADEILPRAGLVKSRWLMSSPLTRDKVMVLATHLTTGETYFFREPQVFTILENRILRELIDSRRGINQRLNIWCAACSTGEETYSVAMLIKKLVGDIKEWDITIVATDINPDFLKKASEGVYGQGSFRNTPTWAVDRYFKKSGVRHEIIPEIRQMVNFSYLNLVRDPYPCLLDADKMDIIFCRNVFIYFDQDNRDKVIQRFYHSMGNGGWLIIGLADAPPGIASGFRVVNYNGLSLYRKDSSGHGLAGVLSAAFQFPSATDYVDGIQPAALQASDFSDYSGGPPCCAVPEKPVKIEPDPCKEAAALYKKGLYEEVVSLLSGMTEDNQSFENRRITDVNSMALLARSLANLGKMDEAQGFCERVVAADKMNPSFHYLLATVHQEGTNRRGGDVFQAGYLSGPGLCDGSVIRSILSRLPKNFFVPIFIVQHMAAGFINGMVEWINCSTPLNVRIQGQWGLFSGQGMSTLLLTASKWE